MTGNVVIEAIAYELAPHRVTSAELESRIEPTLKRLKLPMGQLEALTGIRERRFWDPGVTPSEVATVAARRVIEKSGVDAARIECLINTSVCKDYIEPSVACLVHGNLGLHADCMNYDVGNACLGFLNAIDILAMMIETGRIRCGMIVDGESAREPVEATLARLNENGVTVDDFRDNFATLTLGSGAVAMLLRRADDAASGHRINGSVNLAATEYNRLCVGQRDYMKVDPTALMRAGVGLAKRTWDLASRRLKDWSDDSIALYAPHQVSVRNTEALVEALGLTSEKMFLNVQTQGNIGPAALPITLAMAEEAGRLGAGDHVALMGIGSGLNCSMMSVTW
ncbi:MAG: 3-oxoacyl-ACP synthase III [Gammaproteobacteria bacterium]|nr:3-oxoacyl-ACP synthase III [Gammaproteobacteria bacterium]